MREEKETIKTQREGSAKREKRGVEVQKRKGERDGVVERRWGWRNRGGSCRKKRKQEDEEKEWRTREAEREDRDVESRKQMTG